MGTPPRPWSPPPRAYRRGRRGIVAELGRPAAARTPRRLRLLVSLACTLALIGCTMAVAWSGHASAVVAAVLGAAALAAFWAAGPGEGGR
jgi:hypothetical protein